MGNRATKAPSTRMLAGASANVWPSRDTECSEGRCRRVVGIVVRGVRVFWAAGSGVFRYTQKEPKLYTERDAFCCATCNGWGGLTMRQASFGLRDGKGRGEGGCGKGKLNVESFIRKASHWCKTNINCKRFVVSNLFNIVRISISWYCWGEGLYFNAIFDVE